MSSAVIVPFFHFNGTSKKTSLSLFNFFLKHIMSSLDEVDSLYVIDSGDFIPEIKEVTVVKKPRQSHWQNLNETIHLVKEDNIIILDSDTIIYRTGVLKQIIKDLQFFKVVSILDNSGTVTHKYLEENENRDERHRLCPYLFACKANTIKVIDYDFTPQPAEGFVDSMSKITHDLFSYNPMFKELPDDRWTLYYNNGDFKWFNFSMNPAKKWYKKQDLGYYHLRNMGGALFMHEAYFKQDEAWDKIVEITPEDELIRLLAWAEIITGQYTSIVPDKYRELHKEKYSWAY